MTKEIGVESRKLEASTVYLVGVILAIVGAVGAVGLIRSLARGQNNDSATNSPVVVSKEITTQRACTESVEPASEGNRTASYNGVSFTYPVSLASEVAFEIKPESRLMGETDKPEGVVPAYTAFTFKGFYGSRHESSFFQPELSVYNIEKYKEVLALSPAYVQSLEGDVQSLNAILNERPATLDREVPFLPFGTDATQAFVSRVKYIEFKNGKGIIFLTQFNIEPSLVNNQGLTYIFQGLTDDGLYYVSGRFPVTLGSLPPNYEAKSFEGHTMSMFYGSDKTSNQENYKLYLQTIKRKLVALPPERFDPNLTSVENLIRSLCATRK